MLDLRIVEGVELYFNGVGYFNKFDYLSTVVLSPLKIAIYVSLISNRVIVPSVDNDSLPLSSSKRERCHVNRQI